MACITCRVRKIKCDGALPSCRNCTLRSIRCTYTGERRKRRRLNPDTVGYTAEDSYCFVEGVNSNHRDRNTATTDLRNHPPPAETDPGDRPPRQVPEVTCVDDGGWYRINENVGHVDPADGISLGVASRTAEDFGDGTLLDRILEGDDTDCLKGQSPALWMRVDDGDEYTGPSSGLSTISELGLKSIQDHVPGSVPLCSTISDIRGGILSHLRKPKCIPPDPWPRPTATTVLKPLPRREDVQKYVQAYFSAVQTVFPVLDRAKFESQLAEFFVKPEEQSDSWRALLNAVIASGCRAALSDETASAFQESGQEAWGYFRNALCYETTLVNGVTDLTAVQALSVMTVFAQGMSSPQRLEFTLSSTAARLAHSIALNRSPPAEWNLVDSEKRERNRLFWVVYCLDKTIALRCGRPSVIHDDDISCSFPRGVQVVQNENGETSNDAQGQSQPFDFFLSFTKLARICGAITQGLYSAAALCKPPSPLAASADRILADLESWRQSIPASLRPCQSFSRVLAASGSPRMQLLVLHLSYNYAFCAIHRRFNPMFLQNDENPRSVRQPYLRESPITQIEAARSMVLLMKYLDIESFAPAWLVFYYPMTALTTIFMHVVSNPSGASIRSDIALMDVVVGFFGRLEYMTSGETAFTKTAEFVRQARNIAERPGVTNNHTPSVLGNNETQSPPTLTFTNDTNGTSISQHMNEATQDDNHNNLQLDLLMNVGTTTIPPSQKESAGTQHRPHEYSVSRANDKRPEGGLSSAGPSDVLEIMPLENMELPSSDPMNDNWLNIWMPTSEAGSILSSHRLQGCT